MKILALEPYYDGSHRAFIDGWMAFSTHEIKLLTLPGHHWKWRMRHSSWTFAQQVNELFKTQEYKPDRIFCTSMLNLAEFRGMLAAPLRNIPIVCYFHENQLSYPDPTKQNRDIHFGLSNIISAISADALIFNSDFHKNEFFTSAAELLAKMPDNNDSDFLDTSRSKVKTIHPGINPDTIKLNTERKAHSDSLKIMWAARWEHDKNFEDFSAAIDTLANDGYEFTLCIAGQSFKNQPAIFDKFKNAHADKITHWGYCSSDKYKLLLSECDVFVSTALHEFFGISVIEAICGGCRVLLPKRLAYTDLFAEYEDIFYGHSAQELTESMQELIALKKSGKILPPLPKSACEIALNCTWDKIAVQMDNVMMESGV